MWVGWGWKPELICSKAMLQHPDSKVVTAAGPSPPAPPRAVILTTPVSLAMAKSLPQWPPVWANKWFVRGAVNKNKQKKTMQDGKILYKTVKSHGEMITHFMVGCRQWQLCAIDQSLLHVCRSYIVTKFHYGLSVYDSSFLWVSAYHIAMLFSQL